MGAWSVLSQTVVASASQFFKKFLSCRQNFLTVVLKVVSWSCGSGSRKGLVGSR